MPTFQSVPRRYAIVTSSEPSRDGGNRGIDGRIATADHYHSLADREVSPQFIIGDEADRVDYAGEILARRVQFFCGTETEAEEDRIELLFQPLQR